jgi:hypothetical protein
MLFLHTEAGQISERFIVMLQPREDGAWNVQYICGAETRWAVASSVEVESFHQRSVLRR